MRGTLEFMPMEEATTPRDGIAMCNRYWVVHPTDGVVFYRLSKGYRAAQCNHNEEIAKTIRDRIYPGCDVILIPVVFTGAWEDR
jgi:hypothetical protein